MMGFVDSVFQATEKDCARFWIQLADIAVFLSEESLVAAGEGEDGCTLIVGQIVRARDG